MIGTKEFDVRPIFRQKPNLSPTIFISILSTPHHLHLYPTCPASRSAVHITHLPINLQYVYGLWFTAWISSIKFNHLPHQSHRACKVENTSWWTTLETYSIEWSHGMFKFAHTKEQKHAWINNDTINKITVKGQL